MSEEQLISTPGVFGENGNFLLERELGRGGMGGVYMGRDKMLDRPVAVKVMLKEYGSDAEFVEKFKKEAQAVARLIHPNIAQVYSYGFSEGMPYIAMELVAGGSLDGLMKTHGNKIDVPRVMKICEQVAQALRCAADQGLVHGDVKPENVLLDANGNAKLVDFGLAAMQKDTDEIWGTPYYIAPEKCKRQPVDYRADMYSLGGTIYHALTGIPPFEGEDANDVVKKRFMGPPKKPSEVRPGLSPQIDALVMQMLAVEPQDRFPSFEALLEEFKKVMTTGLSMTSPISPTAAEAGEGAKKPAGGGGKKLVLKGKKTFKMKSPSSAAKTGGGEGGEEGSESSSGAEDAVKKLDDDEEEESSGLGMKVLGVVGGVILLVVLVVGGLFWYTSSSAKSRAAEEQAQIVKGVNTAKESLENTRRVALDLAVKKEEYAKKILNDLNQETEKLQKLVAGAYSDSIAAKMKPDESLSPELAAARAGLAAPAPAAPAPVPEAAPAPAPAPAAPAAPAEGAAPAAPAAPAPAEGEAAPAPAPAEGEAAPAAPAAEEAAPAPVEEEIPAAMQQTIKDMNEQWMKAYKIQAMAINVRAKVTALVNKIDAALETVSSANDEPSMRELERKAQELKEEYDTISASQEVMTAQKDGGQIMNSVRRYQEKTAKRLGDEAKDKAKRDAERQKEIAVLKAQIAAKEEHIQNIESDIALLHEKFDELVGMGLIKQFNWKTMRRGLDRVKEELKSDEGHNQLRKELKKVDALEQAHNTIVKNSKGYLFKNKDGNAKTNLKGYSVINSNEKELVVKAATQKKIPWGALYREYHVALSELINRFVRDGKENCKPRLTHKQWFDAMIGTAYILRNVCADDETVIPYVEGIIKGAVIADTKNKLKYGTGAMYDEGEGPAPINEKDEEKRALLEQLAELSAKEAELDKKTSQFPFYKELFPDIDFAALEAAAEND